MNRTVDESEISARLDEALASDDLAMIIASRKFCRRVGWTRKDRREIGVKLLPEIPGDVAVILMDRPVDNMHILAADDEGWAFAAWMAEQSEMDIREHLSA